MDSRPGTRPHTTPHGSCVLNRVLGGGIPLWVPSTVEMVKSIQTRVLERAILVKVVLKGTFEEKDDFSEIENLALTAGAEVVGSLSQSIDAIHPAYYMGRGKVGELKAYLQMQGADVVIFDTNLSPRQVRDLEQALGVRVIDRTEVILHIFALHARTNEAKLQVELAQLEYTLPRLRRMWTHLERLGGGVRIGMRGPGEKQIEYDRRLIKNRLQRLKTELQHIQDRKERDIQKRQEFLTVSIVGYTNAGKTTLFNQLAHLHQLEKDQLFTTLDTKTSLWKLSNGFPVILSDTVGFIRDLPHNLVASFNATLEEARHADLLILVLDASSKDISPQMTSITKILEELGCQTKKHILVFNKQDKLENHLDYLMLVQQYPDAVFLSCKTGEGLETLLKRVVQTIETFLVHARVTFSLIRQDIYRQLIQHAPPLQAHYTDHTVTLEVRLPKDLFQKYHSSFSEVELL